MHALQSISKNARGLLAAALVGWLVGVANFLWMRTSWDWGWFRLPFVLLAVPAGMYLLGWGRSQTGVIRAAVYCLCYVLVWPIVVILCDLLRSMPRGYGVPRPACGVFLPLA